MADQQARIIITGVDKLSGVVINAAARLELLNKKMSRVSQLGQAVGLVGEQLAPRWERVTTAFSGMRSAAQWMVGMTAAVGGAGAALVGFAKSSADAADTIGDLAERYQIASETLQVVGALVEESGGSMEDAAAAIGKLKKSMNEAIHGGKEQAAAFAGVGLSIADLKRLKPEQVMERMADAFKGSERDMAKQAVLLELMGKNGTVMMAAMNQGGQAWRDKLAEMRADGRIFSQEQLAVADAFDKAWQRAVGAFEGVKNLLGLDLAQALVPVIDATREWLKANRQLIREKFADFLKHLPSLLENIWAVAQVVWQAFSVLAEVVKWFAHTFGMTNTVIAGALLAFAPLLVAVGKLGAALFGVGRAVAAFLGPVGLAAAAVVWLASVIYTNWDAIVGYVQGAWERIKAVFDVGFFDGLIQIWLESWQALANGIIGVIKSIPVISEIPAVKNLQAFTFATERAESLKYGGRSSYDEAEMRRFTAAQAAASQRQDIRNQVSIKIDAEGRPRVTELKSGSPQTELDVSTGLSMVGA